MILPFLFAASVMQATAPASTRLAPEAPVEVAPGVHLIRGAVVPGRGPDGNTIILDAPAGLIVVDTGRHTYHSDAILAFARARARPIAAIVNTHWHLDHSERQRPAQGCVSEGARLHHAGGGSRARRRRLSRAQP